MKWLSSLLAQKREHERTKKKSETYSQEISKEVNSTQVEQSEWLGLNWVNSWNRREKKEKEWSEWKKKWRNMRKIIYNGNGVIQIMK